MPALTLPPLAAVRCFEAAARHLSFTRAAEELGMTQAAVSYQIRILEERVGGPLFARGARGVALTDAGRQLAPRVSDAFAQLRAAFEELSESADGVLSLTVLNAFASNWLVPRLGAFQLQHPKIAVKLDVSSDMIDFSREDVDIGIRTGSGAWPGLTAHKLIPVAYTAMASPTLLPKLPPLNGPADLLQCPLIDPTDAWWLDWFTAAGLDAPDMSARREMRVFFQNLAGSAAIAGHGVALLTPAFFVDEIKSGRLVQLFPFVREPGTFYWLVYRETRQRSPKIRAFRDWLLQEIGAPPMP
jgi:LysR family glycine cleavage system transcriptional activator